MLSQGPKTVEGVAHATGLSVANTSRHLQVLKRKSLGGDESKW
ncbi:MAG: helix-turn-helix domain-containing protein [Streptococcus sp.]